MIPQFFRYGEILELDFTGDGDGNKTGVHPAARCRVLEGKTYVSPWLRIGTPKKDAGGGDYHPLDIGAVVLIACPGGVINQGIILGAVSRVPDEAADYPEDTRVWKFGDLLLLWRRTENDEEITLSMPGGAGGAATPVHLLTMRRAFDTRGVVLQTAGGHYLALQDLEALEKVELSHANGTRLTFDADGVTIGTDDGLTMEIGGSRSVDIGGDDSLTVGGDSSTDVTGDMVVNADGSYTLTTAGMARIVAQAGIELLTASGAPAGIMTGLTQPVCPITGIPLGFSMTVKGSP